MRSAEAPQVDVGTGIDDQPIKPIEDRPVLRLDLVAVAAYGVIHDAILAQPYLSHRQLKSRPIRSR
jgi:hypothetical protein